MSYRNPQQIVDTQSGQYISNLQQTISGVFGNISDVYRQKQDKIEKENKEKELKNNKIIKENIESGDQLLGQMAKINNKALDLNKMLPFVQKYSDTKTKIDLGLMSNQDDLYKAKLSNASIEALPKKLSDLTINMTSLVTDFTETTSKAGTEGGIDSLNTPTDVLKDIMVFSNRSRGVRSIEVRENEDGSLSPGFLIQADGGTANFYSYEDLLKYADGKAEGVLKIPNEKTNKESILSNFVTKNSVTGSKELKKEFLIPRTTIRKDGSRVEENVTNFEKITELVKPQALANIEAMSTATARYSYYTNILKKYDKSEDKITKKDLEEGGNGFAKMSDLYVENFLNENGLNVSVDKYAYEKTTTKELSDAEKRDNLNYQDAKVLASLLKGDGRLKFNYDSILDIASEYGLDVERGATEDEKDKGTFSQLMISSGQGKKISIQKKDNANDIIKKMIRLKSPNLRQSQYEEVFKELEKLKPGEGVNAPKKGDNILGGFFG